MTTLVPGTTVVARDAEAAAGDACVEIAMALEHAIRERGTATLALSGGNTPLASYRLLAQRALPWDRIHVFWVDERAVPPTHERSNYRAAREAFLVPAGIADTHIHRMHGESKDLDEAARAYEAELMDTVAKGANGIPAFDAVVLGIGDDGHTASMFPGDATVDDASRLVAHVPSRDGREARLTLTAPVLEASRESIVIVLGKAKQAALERVWSTTGSLNDTPARVIRNFRGATTWIIDRAAGGLE
jgi:6-phosphogluconolactonase